MTWFKVDDSLHAHVKAMRAGEAALGLWVLAGSWSASQLTDGWIPAYAARRLSPHADELAAALVSAGLWQADEQDGEPGWRFHDWAQYQPSRADVEAKREEARTRMRKARASRPGSPERDSDVRANIPRTSKEPSAKSASSSPNPVPSRPEGSSDEEPLEGRAPARGTRLPDDFSVTDEMVDWAHAECPDVDGRYETAQFEDYWRAKAGPDAEKADWRLAWRKWMRQTQKDLQRQRPRQRQERSQTDANIDAFLRGTETGTDGRTLYALPGGEQ